MMEEQVSKNASYGMATGRVKGKGGGIADQSATPTSLPFSRTDREGDTRTFLRACSTSPAADEEVEVEVETEAGEGEGEGREGDDVDDVVASGRDSRGEVGACKISSPLCVFLT